MTRPNSAAPSLRHSIRFRLLLLFSALIVVVLALSLWVAYREVKGSLGQAAGARAQGAADQLALLLAQSTQQRLADLSRIAAAPAVRQYLRDASDAARQAAEESLTDALRSGSPQIVELWNAAGQRVLAIEVPSSTNRAVPDGVAPSAAGATPLRRHGDAVVSEAVAEIPAEDATDARTRLGFLVVRHPIQISPTSDLLSRLVGSGASVQIGNTADGVWTNLSKAVPAPAIDLTRTGVAEYAAPDGERRIGALADIRGTPWAVWVEFPQAYVLAPAHAFLKRLVLIAVPFAAIGTLLVGFLSTRITTPLQELTEASEAIAAGEYSRRAAVTGRDEIGRLGAAFNEMTGKVESMHLELDERVRQRTARLAETGELLEQRVQDLKDAREEQDQFFALSLDLLCIAGVDGRFRRVNPAWEQVLGWTAGDLTSAPYADFVHPDDRPSTEAEAAKLAEGGVTVNFENRYRCKDGSYKWLNWKAASHPGRGLVYAAARDVTEAKRVARELEQRAADLKLARRQAERANTAKSEFLSRMSHELRTPLNAILGFAQLLEQEDLGGERADNVGQILRGGHHLLELINEVLDISRIESGRLSLSPEPVSLQDVVQRAVALVRPLAAQRGITLSVGPLPDADAALHADRQRLTQILLNLLSNAVKYNRPNGQVTVGFEHRPPMRYRVTVSDTGAGIPPEKLKFLFQPFERLDAALTAVEGTGLGLALSRALAHAMGGEIGVESLVDRGSTFWVELDESEGLVPGATSPIAPEPAPHAAADSRGLVLYIEDNLSNVRLMERVLRKRPGIELLHAPEAKRASR